MLTLRSFVHRHLSPADRLAETLCGLIMVLTFTLVAARQVSEGREGVRSLLFATVGCNVAWGVIDGVLYVLTSMSQRSRRARVERAVRQTPDEAGAVAEIRAALDPALGGISSPADRLSFYRAMVPLIRDMEPRKTKVTLDEILGGLAILIVEVVCTIPASLPFLIFGERQLALRVSNATLLLLLFVAGRQWGKEINGNRFGTGLVMLLLGGLLVAVAIALGG